jgi:hypothetical protein
MARVVTVAPLAVPAFSPTLYDVPLLQVTDTLVVVETNDPE